jgi:IS605 OrfB family transposase
VINEFIDTSRYVYNKTLEYVKNGYNQNKFDLQSLLVTEDTKLYHPVYEFLGKYIDVIKSDVNILKKRLGLIKGRIEKMENMEIYNQEKYNESKNEENMITLAIEKLNSIIKTELIDFQDILKSVKPRRNPLVRDFELFTPKDIRDCAVQSVCDAMKSGLSNLYNGNIRHFHMKYKKKTGKQTIELTPKLIKIENGKIKISPTRFKKNENSFRMSKKNSKKYHNLTLEHNCDLQRINGEYYLYIPVKTTVSQEIPDRTFKNFCGVDPGLRTFATTFNQDGSSTEYKQNNTILFKKLNEKIKMLKSRRERKTLPFNYMNKRYKKKQFNKIEKRKKNLVDSLHWSVINDLIKKNDAIFFGDIKSHNIVKNGKNTSNNIAFNDLKFHKFKQRLLYKASLNNVFVKMTNESYTSKTCSSCGTLNNIGASKFFNCSACSLKCDRDTNAAKNILMKGLLL